MTDKTFGTCFISAPFGVNTLPLRKILEQRGIKWSDATSVEVGASWIDQLETILGTNSFVCAFIPAKLDTQLGNNVFLEIGYALGKSRPVLLFVEPGVNLDFQLRGLPYARMTLENEEAVNMHLETFLAPAPYPLSRRSSPSDFITAPVDTTCALEALSTFQPERTRT